MIDKDKTLDLVASSFELMRGKLTDTEWAEKLAIAMNAESALCIRWAYGKPENLICTSSGPVDTFPTGWANWADHIASLCNSQEPELLEDILGKLDRKELAPANPCDDPQMLVGIVDWQPALIWIAVHRDANRGEFTEEEKQHFREICAYTNRSSMLHKHHARIAMMTETAVDILNNSPQAMVSLAVDGTVHFSNTMGEAILDANDGIGIRHGKLVLSDPQSQAELKEFLQTIKLLDGEKLAEGNPATTRNVSIRRPSGKKAYQILYQSIPFAMWSLEYSTSDRMVITYINDPATRFAPTVKQLQSYYGLTTAQAKVAIAMYSYTNIMSVADHLDISTNTARSHLRAIYAKMGTNNQSELMDMLNSTIKTIEINKPEATQ